MPPGRLCSHAHCRLEGVGDLALITDEMLATLGLKTLELVPLKKMLASLGAGGVAPAPAGVRGRPPLRRPGSKREYPSWRRR